MFITVSCVVLLTIILHFVLVHYGKAGRLINLIPGPRPLPVFGNMHLFQVSRSDLWNLVRQLSEQYYPIYRLWAFTESLVNIRHPDDIETMMGNPKFTQKSNVYNLLVPWFATGLLTSSGRKWQVRRKILTPAFHFNVLQQFTDIFIEEAERMVQILKRDRKPVVRDLVPFISEHTLNIICETAMGTSLKDKGTFQYKYRKAVHDMGKVLVYRFVKPWIASDSLFDLTPKGWEQSRLLKILHGFTKKINEKFFITIDVDYISCLISVAFRRMMQCKINMLQIIQERKQYHDETNGRYLAEFINNTSDERNDDIDVGIRKKRLAMLDLLIAAHKRNQIDDEGIREEVDTFMFRGHDTTAICICFTIMLLAEHKEIQDRAREEVTAIIHENGNKLTSTALQNITYLERCIKESLRLFPSVPFVSRATETDVRLSNYTVPTNTTIHIHIADVHKDPNFWPNPDKFDPDRFLPENSQGRHPYCYIPFSAGPRNCIGQRFAMLEMKTTIGLLLYNFSFEPVDHLKDICMITDLVLRTSSPLRIKFIPLEVSS